MSLTRRRCIFNCWASETVGTENDTNNHHLILSWSTTAMFNALNRFMSRLDGEDPRQKQHQQGLFGFQVLRNANLQLAIEPWFDFVVGINGRMIVRLPFGSLGRSGGA